MTDERRIAVGKAIERVGQRIRDAGDLSQLAHARESILQVIGENASVEVNAIGGGPTVSVVARAEGHEWARTFQIAPREWDTE